MADRIILSPQPNARTISINIEGPRGPRGPKGDGAVNSLAEIPDINTSTLADNYLLVYDITTNKWIAQAPESLLVLASADQVISGQKTFSGTVVIVNPVDFNNKRLTNVDEPVLDTDAATKAYVDANAQGLIIKDQVRVASVGNVALTGTPSSIDGYALLEGERVLLKDQTDATENGIYEFVIDSNGNSLERAIDADEDEEVSSGMFVFVISGDTNANRGYVLSTPGNITLGVTELTFSLFSNAGTITAGDGLAISGQTLNVVSANSGRINVTADAIDLGTVGTPGDYTLVSVDAYGRVVAGEAPTSILDLGITNAVTTDTNILTDAGLTGGGDLSTDRTIALTGQALALHNLSSNGLIARTGSGTVAGRTLTGTADKLTVTNGDGVSGNPTITIASTYAGQDSIVTVGTITTGVWNGTPIGVAYGGTGVNLTSLANDVLIKKTSSGIAAAVAGTDYFTTNSPIDGGTY